MKLKEWKFKVLKEIKKDKPDLTEFEILDFAEKTYIYLCDSSITDKTFNKFIDGFKKGDTKIGSDEI